MTSERRSARGFTLLEVLASVLVLGLVFTMLAEVAIVGLRSEGIDRRRAEASLLADQELALLESLLATGMPLENGLTEKEQEPYRIAIEVLPEDVMALLPPPVIEEALPEDEGELATLLVDDRGDSRVQRIRVVVEWDEGVEIERVERTTHTFDTSELAALFPAEAEPGADGEPGEEPELSLEEQLRSDGPVDFERLMQQSRDAQ